MLTLGLKPDGLNSGRRSRSYDPLREDSNYLLCCTIPCGERRSGWSAFDSFPAIILNAGSRRILIAMGVLYVIAPFPAMAVVGSIKTFALQPMLVSPSAKIRPISPFHQGKRPG